ncbi:YtpI family protein [Alteribacter aurantiacus]|uniref:YtpI family protein n=1 Tax=Alteribacter aurantiacus TaxID=254410 RepID=UPI00041EEE60|nr:YtpI family protein [Alteribacter aurantiacus]
MLIPIIIVVSFVLFVYFKVQQTKARGLMESRWYSSKASVAVGIAIGTFGLNAMINLGTSVATTIGVIFIIYGGINVFFGLKNYKTFLPYARKEVEEIRKQESKEQPAK